MPRWLYIAACLIAFAAIMSVWGQAVHWGAPRVGDWLAARIGETGVWAILAVLVAGGAVAAYRGRNPKGM